MNAEEDYDRGWFDRFVEVHTRDWCLSKTTLFQRDRIMIIRISFPISIITLVYVSWCHYSYVAAILAAPMEVPSIGEWVEKILSSCRHIFDVSVCRARVHGIDLRKATHKF